MTIANSVRYWLFIIPLIPSVIVSIFNLYHLLSKRALRTAINNHVIILLLLCGLIETFTDIIWQIYFYRNGVPVSSTPSFCLTWVYLSSAAYISTYILMAWASMERHILVFYPNWLRSKQNRFYFHYIPLAACILYPSIFYAATLLIMSCSLGFNYNRRTCARYSCLTNMSWLSLWDSIGHFIIPTFLTVIFSVALFIRVIYRRYRARGHIDWRNYKKLTAQLLPISILYITIQFPPIVLYAAYAGGLPKIQPVYGYYSDGLYFTYWVVLLTPFASIASLPDLKTKLRNLLFWRPNRRVQPVSTVMGRRNVNQSTAIKTTHQNANQIAANKITHQNIGQPIEMETIHQNANQPATIKMNVEDVNEPIAMEASHQNVHQALGAIKVTRYLDSPVATLPEIQ
jgi:hypothetical protein